MLETDIIIILYSVYAALMLTLSQQEAVGRKERIYDISITAVVYFISLRDLYLHPDHHDFHGLWASLTLSAALLICFDNFCRKKLGNEEDDPIWE